MASHNLLFVLNSDGELEINKHEAKKIPAFRKIIERDKGSEGDCEGRKKYLASAELYYIFLVYDVRSIYYNLSLLERRDNAKRDAKLPEKWKEDKDIEDAIEEWKKTFKLSSAGKAYVAAEKAYFTMASDTEELQDILNENKALLKRIVKKIEANSKGDGNLELLTNIKEAQAIINDMASTQKIIFNNIKEFAPTGKIVKQLATTFAEEGGNLRLVVGDRSLGNREE